MPQFKIISEKRVLLSFVEVPDQTAADEVADGYACIFGGTPVAIPAKRRHERGFPITLIGDKDHAEKQAELVANLTSRNRFSR